MHDAVGAAAYRLAKRTMFHQLADVELRCVATRAAWNETLQGVKARRDTFVQLKTLTRCNENVYHSAQGVP